MNRRTILKSGLAALTLAGIGSTGLSLLDKTGFIATARTIIKNPTQGNYSR